MTTRTAPRQARSARSLDMILDAAERLLQERGVVETSTVDVAAAANVSVGRLYYWFPDKDAVVRAVLSRAEHRLRALLVELVGDTSLPAPALVDQLLREAAGFFRTHQGSLAVLHRGGMDDHDPGAALGQLFVDMVSEVVQSGVPDIDPAERVMVANTVVRIVVSMLGQYVRADESRAEQYMDELSYVVGAYLHCRYPAAYPAKPG
jgi:AcrR family transcriptional regulator